MTRYRLTYLGTPVGEWRATAREAREDAVALKLGSRDEYVSDRIYLDALAGIETDTGGSMNHGKR